MASGPLSFLENLLAAGVARGTPLLFAASGELLAERAGVLNLGVEGMMLLGAAVGFAVAQVTGSLLAGLLAALAAGGPVWYKQNPAHPAGADRGWRGAGG
jgi:simple sugar transport system permease protein